MSETPAVWLVTGIQAAGKSTVADLLARQFDPAVHIRGAQFYRWATSGWEHPAGSELTPQARRLLNLRYRLSAQVADEYCAAGFTSVVQDNIFGDDVVRWLDRIKSRPRHLVVLRPSAEVVAAREAERQVATGKVAYRPEGFTIEGLSRELDATPRVGLWLDTSSQTPEETVSEVLLRQEEARIRARPS
jgi:chloramphenicol 3-O-phosphotransferase